MDIDLNKDINKLALNEKKEYLLQLKKYCMSLDEKKNNQFGIKVVEKLYPLLRGFPIVIEGATNIPNEPVLFLINHSNSHDFILAQEVLKLLGRNPSALCASDSVDKFTEKIFKIHDSVLVDRRVKSDGINALYSLSKKILDGKDGIIFGESTWNLHPTKVMHNIKLGPAKLASITNVPIVPTIFEYIDVKDICNKEKDIYKKCVIRFDKPIKVNLDKNLIIETNRIQQNMENFRKDIWHDYNIHKLYIEDINKDIYINHTYLKKFGDFTFEFDSPYELQFLYFKDKEPIENEYCLNKEKKLVPGVTNKKSK